MTPEADFVRDHIRARERLARHFDGIHFADPILMILLHLFIAYERGRALSVKQTCVIAGVPNTSALRLITSLAVDGLIRRSGDPQDRRSVLISMTPTGYDAVKAWVNDVMPKTLVGSRH